jgi:hypothetical protein
MLMTPFPAFALDGINKTPPIEVGKIYNAIDEHHYSGRVYYILAEYSDEYKWRSTAFATLPDSTADDMQEEEKEAIVNLETVLV